MAKFDGTRFSKAATPQGGGALNLTNRIVGSNARKQKLTEMSGTNPSKLGGTSIQGAPKTPTAKSSGGSGYAQDTAPHKSLEIEYPFGAGGPGLDEIKLKGFK